jgi:hypothetical protein
VIVRILEHSRGYYDYREVPCATEYVWRPARFVLECGCGEKTLLLGFLDGSRCLCGADLAAAVRRRPGARTVEVEDTNYPWRPSYRAWSSANRNCEYDVWQELRALE